MNKNVVLALGAAAFLIACGGDDTSHDMAGNADMATGDGPPVVFHKLSGFTVDIDKLAGYLHMNPTEMNPATIIMNACVPSTPVYGLYETGDKTAVVMAGADCTFSLQVKEGGVVHMVADAAGTVLPTYSQESSKVGTADISNVPAHVCTSNPYSAPVGVAAAMTPPISVDLLKDQGVCMAGANNHFIPPFVQTQGSSVTADAGYDIYAFTNPMTMPPTFAKQADSPLGIFGITKNGATKDAKITVQFTAAAGSHCNNADGTASTTNAACTYKPTPCDVKPGFITFSPSDPN